MKKTPEVSVIIVNWNGAKYLPECLSALYAQRIPPQEILIIDNASTDDSLHVIKDFQEHHAEKAGCSSRGTAVTQKEPAIRLIPNTSNIGFGCAYNQGFRVIFGEYVLLLNADVVLEQDFLTNVLLVMQRDESVGLAVGKLVNYEDRRRIDSTGLVIHKNRRAYDRGQGEIDAGRYEQAEEVFGASGAACLCRRTMLEDIRYSNEYFDDLFFAYKEDIDLSWRARLYGWKCMYTPQAVGWHYRKWGTGKRRDIPRWVRRHSLKNRYLMLLKNDTWKTLLPGIWHLLRFEIISLAYILFREPHLFLAFVDIVQVFPRVMQKRRQIQRIARQRQQIDRIQKWFL